MVSAVSSYYLTMLAAGSPDVPVDRPPPRDLFPASADHSSSIAAGSWHITLSSWLLYSMTGPDLLGALAQLHGRFQQAIASADSSGGHGRDRTLARCWSP
jgi:hypothetical protein